MSADETETTKIPIASNLPKVLRLRSQGTFLAKSSDFTRDAAILHTTEIEVDIQGVHNGDSGGRDGSAGVGFVSAKTRLDRIFQNDIDARSSSSKPPPPPPPPPPSVILSKKQVSSDEPKKQNPSTVRDEASEGSTTTTKEQVAQGGHIPSKIIAPPPIEGMYFRSPTRHIRLIKTRLSDLPVDIQDQEPRIRGGVAVYKVSDAHHREKYGSMVEINAVDYIDKLKSTVLDLERQLSVLQGILEQERESRQTTKNVRGSLRMATFIGRRSKDPEYKSEKSNKRSLRSKNNSNLSGNNSNASSGMGSPGSSISEFKNPGFAPRPPTSSVNFPHGFGFNSDRSKPAVEDQIMPTIPKRPKPGERGPVHTNGALSNRQQSTASSTEPTKNQDGASETALKVYEGHTLRAEDTPTSSQVHSAAEAESENTESTENLNRTFQPRGLVQRDRIAAPMPSLEARKIRRGKAGRTRSFSAMPNDDIRLVSSCDYDEEKVSRAVSMHRESNAEPPTPTPAAKKSRGVPTVLKLFTRRS